MPLHYAADGGHTDAINALIAHGADKNAVLGDDQETALHTAARRGHVRAVVSLIKDHGLDPNAVATHGKTPLLLAVDFGTHAAVEALLKNGAKADAVDHYGHNALHYAAIRNKGIRNCHTYQRLWP